MAPEIVDLISDDEDIDVPGPSKSVSQPRVRPESSSNPTINPALLSRRKPAQFNPFDTRGSTPSSHTEHNSPSYDALNISLSPLFVPQDSPQPRDNGKGKGRASPIPEIDLSRDTDDDDSPAPLRPDETWEYGNGVLTEEDALKQAIALSLQEQKPSPARDRENTDTGSSSSTPPRKGTIRDRTISPPPARAEAVRPLPNWHTSPDKAKAASSAILENMPNSSCETSAFLAQDHTAIPIAHKNLDTSAVPATIPNLGKVEQKQPAKNDPEPPTMPPSTAKPNEPEHKLPPIFGLAGLDRKQMETERLARLKRKHVDTEAGPAQERPSVKVAKVTQSHSLVSREKTVSPPPLKLRRENKMREGTGQVGQAGQASSSLSMPRSSTTASISHSGDQNPRLHNPISTISIDENNDDTPHRTLYPLGAALKTYISGFPSANTMSFPNLIAPTTHLESTLLSSFIWSHDWLLPHFETRRTKFQLVMHAKIHAERELIKQDWAGVPNVRLTFPPMDGNVNCMHSKLMLLFYKEEEGTGWEGGQRCRIAVPTANLVDFDWGVGSFMENTVWLIDLPLKKASSSATETHFQKSLKQFLKAQTIPEDVLQKLDCFDFSKTAQYGFVHTIGGMHSGQAWKTTGLCGMGRTITQMGLATKEHILLDYVTSSVGSLNDEFMSSMYLAAQGDDGLKEYTRRVNKAPIGKQQGSWKENFRLYFPSDDTVRASKGGPNKAGTICFSMKWWQNPKFPRSNMLDCISVRDRILMHNKLLFVRYAQTSQLGNAGFVYVGSANLSESAWGRLVQDKATKEPRLNCRNWECGVIIPIPANSSGSKSGAITSHIETGLASFAGHIPVPMRYPSDSMGGKKPWTNFES